MRATITPVDFVLVPTRQKPFNSANVAVGRSGGKLGSGGKGQAANARDDFLDLIKKVNLGKFTEMTGEAGVEEGMVRQVQWTQMRRLVHLRLPGAGWDLVLGGVRRRG